MKKPIFNLQTYNWNKLTRSQQDKALEFMRQVLRDLEGNRKYGFDKNFWASYPLIKNK